MNLMIYANVRFVICRLKSIQVYSSPNCLSFLYILNNIHHNSDWVHLLQISGASLWEVTTVPPAKVSARPTTLSRHFKMTCKLRELWSVSCFFPSPAVLPEIDSKKNTNKKVSNHLRFSHREFEKTAKKKKKTRKKAQTKVNVHRMALQFGILRRVWTEQNSE